MRVNRLLAAALAAATLAGTAPALQPPASAAQPSSFTDLSDPKQAEAAEFLKLLGVVNGVPGGAYNPSGTLSRAEFCKMAVSALDRADEELAQRGRTIYFDVGPTHWARGYINLASTITLGSDSDGKGGTALVAGAGDGNFYPDQPITYGAAVAILCRMLGYGVNDVATGGAWYDGYLATGAANGLTDGIYLSGDDVIDRGQAAILFYNLYFTKSKGSDKTYLVSMGGKEEEGGIILDTDATADDGTTGSVETTKGTYKTDRSFDPSLEGQEGKAFLDKDGKLLAFQPKEGTSQKSVNVLSASTTYLTISGGDKLDVEPDTVVYQDGKATTWDKVYLNVASSTAVTFHYGANGKLAYLFFPSESADGPAVMVARSTPNGTVNPFSGMAGGGTYTMFKNGVAASASDIRQYDVATYDSGTRIIQVSDLKLTGIYENASPSPSDPTSVKVMGHDFPVLSTARNDLSSFKVGDKITLLLTSDGRVAGAVPATAVKGEAVGIATVSKGDSNKSTATVKLLQGGLEVKGEVSSGAADTYNNQLVTVTSNATGRLSLNKISGSAAKGTLDVAARKLGEKEIAENVAIYDRVKDGAMVAVEYEDLSAAAIPSSKISFVSYDYAGRVKYLVLDDATGDAYTYGYLSYTSAETRWVDDESRPIYKKDESGNLVHDGNGDPILLGYEQQLETTGTPTLCVRQGDKDGKEVVSSKGSFIGSVRNGAAGGVAYGADGKVVASVYLQSLTGVNRTAFDPEEMTVTVAGVAYPVSEAVQCYNKTTKTWFAPGKDGMEAARAYSDDLTLYYDRAPSEGGKIRMIVVP